MTLDDHQHHRMVSPPAMPPIFPEDLFIYEIFSIGARAGSEPLQLGEFGVRLRCSPGVTLVLKGGHLTLTIEKASPTPSGTMAKD